MDRIFTGNKGEITPVDTKGLTFVQIHFNNLCLDEHLTRIFSTEFFKIGGNLSYVSWASPHHQGAGLPIKKKFSLFL